MLDSWYCLDQVVPEGMSQVSRPSEVGNHHWNGALSTPGYLLALLQELSHVPWGLTEIADAKQVQKTNKTGILYRIKKGVCKWILTFRTKISWISFWRGSGPPWWWRPLSTNPLHTTEFLIFQISFFLVETIWWICIFLVKFLPGTTNLTIFVALNVVLVRIWNPDPTVWVPLGVLPWLPAVILTYFVNRTENLSVLQVSNKVLCQCWMPSAMCWTPLFV